MCVFTIDNSQIMWYTYHSKEREVKIMTNFQYIMSKIKDVDIAALFTHEYDNTQSILTKGIDIGFWNWYKDSNKPLNISFQIWLTLQYNPKDWEE